MSIKNASAEYKLAMGKDPNSEVRFYIDPRRVEYAPIAGTETYYTNLSTDPVMGEYSLSQSTSQYMYQFDNPVSSSTTFEIMYKPMFAYDIADSQFFFIFKSQVIDAEDASVSLWYDATNDQLGAILCYGTGLYKIANLGTVYTSNAQLQQWIRITCVCAADGMTIYSNGGNPITVAVSAANWDAVLNMQFLRPSNNTLGYINYGLIIKNFAATTQQVADNFRGVRNEQILFTFQKCGIGKTRCDVTSDVTQYAHEYQDGYKAATCNITLNNLDGRYSADQYAAFQPESMSYNGLSTQAYLANNKIGLSYEQWSKQKISIGDRSGLKSYHSCDSLPNISDNAAGTVYSQDAWVSTDSWLGSQATVAVAGGTLIATSTVSSGQYSAYRSISFTGKQISAKIKTDTSTTVSLYIRVSGIDYNIKTIQTVAGQWILLSAFDSRTVTLIQIMPVASVLGETLAVDYIYVGSGLYDTQLIDYSSNGNNGIVYGAMPCVGVNGNSLCFNGMNSYVNIGNIRHATASTYSAWVKINAWPSVYGMIFARASAPWYMTIYTTGGNHIIIFSWVNISGIQQTHAFQIDGIINLNEWHHIAATHDGTYSRLYIDGNIVSTSGASSIEDESTQSGAPYLLGAFAPDTYLLDGDIDEPRIYGRALTAAEISSYIDSIKNGMYSLTSDSQFENQFYGLTNSGAFQRTTNVSQLPTVSIAADDFVKTIAERKVRSSRYWEDYHFSQATPSNDSLFHEYTWLATKKEIYNYLGNSGFENATIANSWSVGNGTIARVNTYAMLGTYCCKLEGTNAYTNQSVSIDVNSGQKFTFQVFARGDSGQAITVTIAEYTGATLNGASTSSYILAGSGWQSFYVSRVMTNSASNIIACQVTVPSAGSEIVYLDMAMLTFGDVKNFYVENANDGTSGTISSALAQLGTYDLIGIDAEDVTYTHPCATIVKDESPWEMLKQLCDATICRFMHIYNGLLKYRSYLTSDTSTVSLGVLPKSESVTNVRQGATANKITVEGIVIYKPTMLQNVFQSSKGDALMEYSDSEVKFIRSIDAYTRFPTLAEYPKGFELVYNSTFGEVWGMVE
jgi:hypothetical protein